MGHNSCLKSGCALGTMWEVIKGGVVCVMDLWFMSQKMAEATRTVILFIAHLYSGLVPEISHFKDFATIAGYHGNTII